jgi:hypothetical protein
MTLHALKQAVTVASTGTTGRARFNLVNGYIAQKLLFRRDLERKPVPLAWFRTLWPLLRQRRMLLPLVQPKGIYCFYSDRLIKRLARLIGDRPCLEISAGDGTLTRLLRCVGQHAAVDLLLRRDRREVGQHLVNRIDARRARPMTAADVTARAAPDPVPGVTGRWRRRHRWAQRVVRRRRR